MIIRLEARAHQHLALHARIVVELHRLHIAMHVDIPDVGGVDAAILIGIMYRAGVGKPAPRTLPRVSWRVSGR